MTEKMGISFFKSNQNQSLAAVNTPRARRDYTEHSAYQLYHPSTGESWWLRNGDSTIGRSLDNDIVLRDDSVSRHHASIRVDVNGTAIFIEDLRSVNGLHIGGRRVKRAILPRDVLFCLGTVNLVLRKPGAFESGQPLLLRD